MVPREIFDQIPTTNINLYKTCKIFYYHVESFYKNYIFNCYTNLSMNESDMSIDLLIIPVKKQCEEMRKYINNNVYKVMHYNPLLYQFNKLIKIDLCDEFNAPLILPPTVTYLKMGRTYNHSLPFLPKLKCLICNTYFNQDLINLSSTLKSLTLGCDFQSQLILPPFLTKLELGSRFDSVLNLPTTLQSLHLGYRYNQPLILPPNLKYLFVGNYYDHLLTLPSHLKILHLKNNNPHYYDFSLLPLEELSLGKGYTHPLSLPPTVKYLSLSKNYPYHLHLDHLPKSLKTLRMGINRINLDYYREKID